MPTGTQSSTSKQDERGVITEATTTTTSESAAAAASPRGVSRRRRRQSAQSTTTTMDIVVAGRSKSKSIGCIKEGFHLFNKSPEKPLKMSSGYFVKDSVIGSPDFKNEVFSSPTNIKETGFLLNKKSKI